MESNRASLPSLEFLEVMLINACNLSCRGCTTFSDLKHSGYVPWDTGKQWLMPWLDRINIKAIGVMGGEPLMNPEIGSWLRGLRLLLPDAQIRFITNGLLIPKHPDLLDLLDELGNSIFKISVHLDDVALEQTIADLFNARDWEPVYEFGINRWKSPSGLRLQIARPPTFLKTFRGSYADMEPHDSDPKEAFDLCVQKNCPLLMDGLIWKCSTAALMPSILSRFGQLDKPQWQPYMPAGLSPQCSDQDLRSFAANMGKPHAICRQCPTEHDIESVFDHKIHVHRK